MPRGTPDQVQVLGGAEVLLVANVQSTPGAHCYGLVQVVFGQQPLFIRQIFIDTDVAAEVRFYATSAVPIVPIAQAGGYFRPVLKIGGFDSGGLNVGSAVGAITPGEFAALESNKEIFRIRVDRFVAVRFATPMALNPRSASFSDVLSFVAPDVLVQRFKVVMEVVQSVPQVRGESPL